MARESPSDAPDDVRATARRYFELAKAAKPNIVLGYEAFEQYMARHAEPGREAYVAEMYLACACAEGIDEALEELESLLSYDVARAVASVDASRHFVEEVLQVTRERLLVPKPGEPAKIASYAGKASLRSWLCAVAVRAAIDQRRRKSEPPQYAFALASHAEALAKGGPEFDYLRRRYKDAFENSVRTAIEQLEPKQRMLLRLNAVDGLSVDKLAAMYKVGRSTAARWLAAARKALFERAQSELHSHLGVSSAEIESLARDMLSQIDVSIVKLLGR